MRLKKAERDQVRAMFGGLCAYCGKLLGERWHADHVEPVVRNDWFKHAEKRGPDHPERDHIGNLMPACPPCNIDKHSLPLEGWRRKLQDACNVLARNQPTYRHAVRFGLVTETAACVTFHFERAAATMAQTKETP
jgi:hypothetical protein